MAALMDMTLKCLRGVTYVSKCSIAIKRLSKPFKTIVVLK